MNGAAYRVLREIRQGVWRKSGRKTSCGKYAIWYDIGMTRADLLCGVPMPARRMDSILAQLVARGHVVHRASQKRWVFGVRAKREGTKWRA